MSSEKNYWTLLIFFLICFGVATSASQFVPGEWYQNLQRAPWSPPNIVFPIVWTVLYAMIAVVGWLLFSQADRVLKALWILQLVFNALWSWLFFGQHWVSLALLDIVALGVVLVILIFACLTRGQRLAGYLLLPYLIWIMLASSLNGYVVLYN